MSNVAYALNRTIRLKAAGESAGLVQEIKPAGKILHEMINEAERIIEDLGQTRMA